eukprot:SAG31_NODE_1471_length_8213_cov_71.355065_3_plen_55_part_00
MAADAVVAAAAVAARSMLVRARADDAGNLPPKSHSTEPMRAPRMVHTPWLRNRY